MVLGVGASCSHPPKRKDERLADSYCGPETETDRWMIYVFITKGKSKKPFNMAIVVHAMISVLSGLITMGSSKRISDIQISKGTTFEICNEHWAQNPLTGTNQKLLHPSSINTEKTANMLVGWICWILPPLVTGKPGYFLRRRKVNHRGIEVQHFLATLR